MELPIVAPAPVVTEHTAVFRGLFANHRQFQHFQHYLTGLIVLPNESMATIARCILDSPDKTKVSRFLAEAVWQEDMVNRRRSRYMLQEMKPHRHRRRESIVVLMIPAASTWGASLTTWTATITMAMGPIPWLIIRSPTSMLVARCASRWGYAAIAGMRNSPNGQPASPGIFRI